MNRSRGAIGAIFLCLLVAIDACAPVGRGTPQPSASTPAAGPTSAPASSARAPTPFVSPSPASPTVIEIAVLRDRLASDPNEPGALRDLGLALLQRFRETADPTLYTQADEALARARKLAPDDPLILVAQGGLQLGRHQFTDALVTGRAILAQLPELPAAKAIEIDALVELGRYDQADTAVKALVASRQDIVSLPRESYLRELHGDLHGAIEAMRLAVASPGIAQENTAYVQSLLGTLLVRTGDNRGGQAAYEAALKLVPNHAPSIAGLGRLAVGRGDLTGAIDDFIRASAVLPLPEYVVALGEAQEASGDREAAGRTYDLARAEIGLFEAAGTQVDLELALFEADHGNATRALELAQKAYKLAPTIRAADAVGWALHRLGRDHEALDRATEALRLGSRDPLLVFHRGAIRAALGMSAAARTDLDAALRSDPGFSATGVAEARRVLAALPS